MLYTLGAMFLPGGGDSCSQVEQDGHGGLLPPQQPVSKAKCLDSYAQAAMRYLRDSLMLLAVAYCFSSSSTTAF